MYYSIPNVPYDQEPSKLPPPAAYGQPPAYGVPASAPNLQYYGAGDYAQHESAAPPPPLLQSGTEGSDIPNCCMTFWFRCVTFGQIADIVDKGSTYK
ncbi:hypothetical protein SLA2020_321380 [Shorea laevis]